MLCILEMKRSVWLVRAGGRMMNEQVRLVVWPMMHKLAGHGNKFQQPFQLCLFGSVVQPHSVF